MWLLMVISALPAMPLFFLVTRLREKYGDPQHDENIAWFLLSVPVGFILWLVIFYELYSHVRFI